MPRNNEIQFRRGTGTEWLNADPILASGEPAFNVTDYTLKIGDGFNYWSDLPTIGASGTDTYIDSASFNQQSGILTLGYNTALANLTVSIPAIASSGDNSVLVYKNVSTATNLIYEDHLVFVDTSASAVDLQLPLASGHGGKQFIIKQKSGLNSVNIYPSGSETIDDRSVFSITYSKNSISLVSDNSNWFII